MHYLQGDFDLSKFQLGVLAAIFMVGLMIASVLLTQLTRKVSPFRLIGIAFRLLCHLKQHQQARCTLSSSSLGSHQTTFLMQWTKRIAPAKEPIFICLDECRCGNGNLVACCHWLRSFAGLLVTASSSHVCWSRYFL